MARRQTKNTSNTDVEVTSGSGSVPGVTIREFAESMGVAYQTVQRWIHPGGMPVLGWIEIGGAGVGGMGATRGRRFVRLDPERCRAWALANRPALSGVGPGGWRPGSGRTKNATPKRGGGRTAKRGTTSRSSSHARLEGTVGVFVPNSAPDVAVNGTAHAPQSSTTAASHSSTIAAPSEASPYLAAKTAALMADVKIKELKYRQLAGKALDAEEVTREWSASLAMISSQMNTVAPAAARSIVARLNLTDPDSFDVILRAIEEEILRVRAALANAGHADSGHTH